MCPLGILLLVIWAKEMLAGSAGHGSCYCFDAAQNRGKLGIWHSLKKAGILPATGALRTINMPSFHHCQEHAIAFLLYC